MKERLVILKRVFGWSTKKTVWMIRRGGEVWFSLGIGLLELITGLVSAVVLFPLIDKAPWILSIFPVLLTVRGANNGIFSGVLTTSLYLGVIEPRFKDNTDAYYGLVFSIYTISFINSIIAIAILALYLGNPQTIFFGYSILITTSFIAVTFSLIATSLVGFVVYKRGMNPDDVVYPVMSTVNDVMITIFLSIAVMIIQPWNTPYATRICAMIIPIIVLFNMFVFLKYRKNETYRKVIREGQIGIVYSIIASSIAGTILATLYDYLVGRPILIVLLPFVMTTMGDVGSIMASRLTTSLHLGEVSYESFGEVALYLVDQLGGIILPLITALSATTLIAGIITLTTSQVIITVALQVYSVALVVVLLEIPFIYFIAVQTFVRGLNPDNFTIPIITSTADLMTILIIFLLNLVLF